ncbi:MAG: 23S rRNA (uracil(1939)-C(5))-methyltransferase RlmD [Candidatus Sulfotelmatobacter sp.]
MLLTIEKLIYGGDGLARLPADAHGRGKAVFLPFVLAGEQIEASVTEQKPGFARAEALAIITPSPHRVLPACPYFGQCGGCHYQHASYEHQLEIKKEILRETLRRTAKVDLPCQIQVHASPPWNYRNRLRLQVKTQPSFAAGYFKLASHELLPVEECPISSPLINRAISALWQSGRAGKVPEGVQEVEFFANADDSQLVVELYCGIESRRAAVRAWAEELRAAMPEIAGVAAFRRATSGMPGSQDKLLSVGVPYLTYETQRAAYRVSTGSFFQTNRHLTDELVKVVTEGMSGELALDLYAGVGLFSTALACDFHHIVSVESSQTSSGDLVYNLPSNGEAVQATTEQYLARTENSGRAGKGNVLPHMLHTPDLAVVDPPRSGLGERVVRQVANLDAPRLTYVSCDPATLARDLVPLLAAGYRLEQVHLVDLFPQTYHLESVVQLVK